MDQPSPTPASLRDAVTPENDAACQGFTIFDGYRWALTSNPLDLPGLSLASLAGISDADVAELPNWQLWEAIATKLGYNPIRVLPPEPPTA